MSGAAETAQRLRKDLLAWPDLETVHGPLLQRPDQFFLRFEMRDGTSFAIELTKEKGE